MDSGDIALGYFCSAYYAFTDQTVSHVDARGKSNYVLVPAKGGSPL